MASNRDIEVEYYKEIVGHRDTSPVLCRAKSVEKSQW